MVVSSVSDTNANQFVVSLQAVSKCRNTSGKAEALIVVFAWVEKVDTSVGTDGPIVVLATAIDAGKRLLVEKHYQTQLRSFMCAHLHEENVVIARSRGDAEDGAHLVLTWSNLVMLASHGHANLQHHSLNSCQQRLDVHWNWAKVLLVHLLIPGRKAAEQGASAIQEVWALLELLGGDDKEFLLPTDV